MMAMREDYISISVIVPVYNVRSYLRECIESLAEAIVQCVIVKIELICVDDGSTDGSGKLLDNIAAEDRFTALSRLTMRIIHKANGGEGSARNVALDVATGDWLMYLDSDDIVAPQIFKDITKAHALYPHAEIIRVCTAAYADGQMPQWRIDAPMSLVDMSQEIISGCYMFGVTEMAYSRKKFGHIRFKNYSIGADLVYTSECFSLVNLLADTSCADYGYRVRAESMAHRKMSPKKLRDTIDYLEEMFTHYQRSGKRIPLSIARGRGNAWFEGCARDVLAMSDRSVRRELWQHWLRSLSTAKKMTLFTPWQRFVLRVMCVTHSEMVARMLLVFPDWLKRQGVHR